MSTMEFLLGWIAVSTATALVVRPWLADRRQRIPVVVRSTERVLPGRPIR